VWVPEVNSYGETLVTEQMAGVLDTAFEIWPMLLRPLFIDELMNLFSMTKRADVFPTIIVERRESRTEIDALLIVIFRVIVFAGAQRSSPACEASIVQIFPLPTTSAAVVTAKALEVVETVQIFGVKDFKVTASLEPALDLIGVTAPISVEVGALMDRDCGTLAPGSGVVMPVIPRAIEELVPSQYPLPAKVATNWQFPFHIPLTVA
jgi:hypothetical protein